MPKIANVDRQNSNGGDAATAGTFCTLNQRCIPILKEKLPEYFSYAVRLFFAVRKQNK
jgi:hypothetical protein